MAARDLRKGLQFRDREAQRVTRLASTVGGLVYGLIFAVTVWGYDTWVLTGCRVEWAWGKISVGVPLVLAIGLAAGTIAGAANRATASVLAWLGGGFSLGLVAGWMPYGGSAFLAWVAEPRLRGLPMFLMGPAEVTRMWFLAILVGFVGAAVGLVMYLLAEKAWDLARPDGRMSGQSWLVLLLCAPLAILPGIAADDIANRDLRGQLRAVHDLIAGLPATDSIGAATLAPYRDMISPEFVLYLAESDSELLRSSVDVVFDNGFIARCSVLGETVAACQPLSLRMNAWMRALLADALTGGDISALAAYADQLAVAPQVQTWLAQQRGRIGAEYQIAFAVHRDGWVIMQAVFSPTLVLECYFSGATPTELDRCQWQE